MFLWDPELIAGKSSKAFKHVVLTCSLPTKKKLFSTEKCCFNEKLIHQQSICTRCSVQIKNKWPWAKLPAVRGQVKSGWWCSPSLFAKPLHPHRTRATKPRGAHAFTKMTNSLWSEQTPTFPKGIHPCTVLALALNFGKENSEGHLGLREPHVANYLSSMSAESEDSERTWNPRLPPQNVNVCWRGHCIHNNDQNRSPQWHSGGSATCLSVFHMLASL